MILQSWVITCLSTASIISDWRLALSAPSFICTIYLPVVVPSYFWIGSWVTPNTGETTRRKIIAAIAARERMVVTTKKGEADIFQMWSLYTFYSRPGSKNTRSKDLVGGANLPTKYWLWTRNFGCAEACLNFDTTKVHVGLARLVGYCTRVCGSIARREFERNSSFRARNVQKRVKWSWKWHCHGCHMEIEILKLKLEAEGQTSPMATVLLQFSSRHLDWYIQHRTINIKFTFTSHIQHSGPFSRAGRWSLSRPSPGYGHRFFAAWPTWKRLFSLQKLSPVTVHWD